MKRLPLFSQRRRFGVELAVTVVAVLVMLAASVDAHRFRLAAPQERLAAPRGERSGARGEVCLVLDTQPKVAASVSAWNLDAQWLNSLEQEVGSATVIPARQLSRSAIETCVWLLVPARAGAAMDATQVQFVRGWMEDGGLAVVELPTAAWAESLGIEADLTAGKQAARMVRFDTPAPRGGSRAEIIKAPFSGVVARFNPKERVVGRDLWMPWETDAGPAAAILTVGKGKAMVWLTDVTKFLAMMQQGRPDDGFRLPQRRPEWGKETTLSAASVTSSDMLDNQIPYADLLERHLLYFLDLDRPIPRLWLYPGTLRGALIATHSEAGDPRRAGFFADWERQHGLRSTLFAAAEGLSPEELAKVGRAKGELQLEWVPRGLPRPPTKRWGVGTFAFLERPLSLQEQQARLSADALPYGPATATRTRLGSWPSAALAGFDILEGAEVAFDMSLGPAPSWLTNNTAMQGYLFGTGYPFRPIGKDGVRYGLMELPTVVSDAAAGYSLPRLKAMMRASSEGHHTIISADWTAVTMVNRPSFDALAGWRDAKKLAGELEMWVTTPTEWLAFAERRSRVQLHSTFARDQGRLVVEVQAPTEPAQASPQGNAPAAEAAAPLPAVAVPARYRGQPIRELLVNGQPQDLTQLPLSGDQALVLVPNTLGSMRLSVLYAEPVVEPPPAEAPPP